MEEARHKRQALYTSIYKKCLENDIKRGGNSSWQRSRSED